MRGEDLFAVEGAPGGECGGRGGGYEDTVEDRDPCEDPVDALFADTDVGVAQVWD